MNMGMPEVIFIFLLALILFGPKKLPEIGREIGKFMAELKRASSDFKCHLQSEIERAGENVGTPLQLGAQQTSLLTQTLLPPAVKSAISEIDSAHERLMQVARTAFDAQSFTLHLPETPMIASAESVELAGPLSSSTNVAQARAVAVPHEESPITVVTDLPTPVPKQDKCGSCSAD